VSFLFRFQVDFERGLNIVLHLHVAGHTRRNRAGIEQNEIVLTGAERKGDRSLAGLFDSVDEDIRTRAGRRET
jgi:hypothetical protein